MHLFKFVVLAIVHFHYIDNAFIWIAKLGDEKNQK